MRSLLLLLLLASPAAAQVRGWPPYLPHGRTVSTQAVGVDTTTPTSPALYYIMPTSDSLYVRGRISATKDVVQRFGFRGYPDLQHVEIYDARILTAYTPNTLGAYRQATTIANGTVPNSLDAGPIYTWNCGAIMGPHALSVPVVESVGHDKATADLLSIWSDGTHYFRLVAISGNNLTFYSMPDTTDGIWHVHSTVTAAPQKLGHVFGATHTDSITVTSQTVTEKAPNNKNASIRAILNGTKTLVAGTSGPADSLKIVEEFDLVDPSTLDSTNVPWQWNDGAAWMHVRNVYYLTGNCTIIHSTYTAKRDMGLWGATVSIMGKPVSANHDSTYFYIPKTKTTLDWTVPKLYETPFTTQPFFNPLDVVSTSNPPDRAMVLLKRTGQSTLLPFDLGVAFGYGPYLSAAPAVRGAAVAGENAYWNLSGQGKLYPSLFGEYDTPNTQFPTGSVLEALTYRQWLDPTAFGGDKVAYWNKATPNGDDLVFVDYWKAVTADATVLPSSMTGKTISVVDTLNVTVGQSVVPATGVTITTNPGAAKGFAVLRLSNP